MQFSKINSVGKALSFGAEKLEETLTEEEASYSSAQESPRQSHYSRQHKNGEIIDDEFTLAMQEFTDASDNDLKEFAAKEPRERYKRTAKQLLGTMFVAVPVIDIATTSVTKRGNISAKLTESIKHTGRWGAILGAGLLLLGLKRAVNKSSPEMKNIDENHRLLALGMDFTALSAGFLGIKALKNKSVNLINEHAPKTVDYMKTKIIHPFKNKLDKSSINKNILLPAEKKIFKPSKNYGRPLSLALGLLAPAIAITALAKGMSEMKRSEAEAQDNYSLLKATQDGLREEFGQEHN